VATRNAAGIGRLFGYLLIAGGVFLILQSGDWLLYGVWFALIGWFLSNAAESTIAQVSVEQTAAGDQGSRRDGERSALDRTE